MSKPVLKINQLSKSFGAVHASQDVSLCVQKGEIHALIGPNGAGKSTIIGQIAGSIRPDEGIIELDGNDITSLNVAQRVRLGLGRSFQVSAVIPLYTVEDNILLALLGREQQGFNLFSNAHKNNALVDEVCQHAGRVRLENRLKTPASDLSHGERRRRCLWQQVRRPAATRGHYISIRACSHWGGPSGYSDARSEDADFDVQYLPSSAVEAGEGDG